MNRKWLAALALAMLLGTACASEGTDVAALEQRLLELGYRETAGSGVLDETTANALRNFQIANALEPTGAPDADTSELLFSGDGVHQSDYLAALAQQNADAASLAMGDYGDAVIQLQRALKDLGFFNGEADGAFGDATETAVCRFQLANGLQETGVADGTVQLRLYEGTPIGWEDFLQGCCSSAGDSGGPVRTVQLWLRRNGYFQGACTGRYGDGTQQAVKRFQAASGLETSGAVDLNTSRLLFANVQAEKPGSAILRRGDVGAEADALCRALSSLNYPAHDTFDMQTELALMQFQHACGLEPTGVADGETTDRLYGENAPVYAQNEAPGAVDAETLSRIARRALALLGQTSELEEDFGLVQHVYLQCGVNLANREALIPIRLGAADGIEAGSVLEVQLDGRRLCGIASSDRALIYRADSGYIVMGYLDSMQAEAVWLCRPEL